MLLSATIAITIFGLNRQRKPLTYEYKIVMTKRCYAAHYKSAETLSGIIEMSVFCIVVLVFGF